MFSVLPLGLDVPDFVLEQATDENMEGVATISENNTRLSGRR